MIVRQPLVVIGLALIVVPIVIHLLVRAPARTVDVPSLRFLRASRMRALRRRLIEDAGLLAVRALALAAAVLALADPLLVTGCRRSAWDATVRRAVVLHGVDPQSAVAREALADGASLLSTTDLRDGLWRAQMQLASSGPGRREIVLVSRFEAGSLDSELVDAVPRHIGLRFVREDASPSEVVVRGPDWTRGARARLPVTTTLGRVSTRLVAGAPLSAPIDVADEPGALALPAYGFRFEYGAAPPADGVTASAAARAAVQAVLETGVAIPAGDGIIEAVRQRPLVLRVGGPGGTLEQGAPWMAETVRAIVEDDELSASAATAVAVGSPDSLNGVVLRDRAGAPLVSVSARRGDPPALVVDLHGSPATPILPLLVRRLLATRSPRLSPPTDPLTIPPGQLAAWSRTAAALPTADLPREWSDRRWAWGFVLGLLSIEWVWRRGRSGRGGTAAREGEHAA